MYQPSAQVTQRYADVFVNFALNGGEGVRPGEVVNCIVPLEALPMYKVLQEAILKAGAHPLMMLIPYQFERDLFEHAGNDQLEFFPDKYWKGYVEQIDHRLTVLPRDAGPRALEGISAGRLKLHPRVPAPLRAWMNEKELAGKLSWTLGMWGTQEYADEAGMSLEEYWDQIIQACYLDQDDPIFCWRAAFAENARVRSVLNGLPIKTLHLFGSDADLWVTLGKKRRWVGGSGRNIPSFEVFTSPHCNGAEGYINFSETLYYNGMRVEGIYLEFHQGRVVKASATLNEDVLLRMLETKNADRLGEFSLTDGRFSRITRCMANTLFDENRGGPEGNAHLALGMPYPDTYDGDPRVLTPAQWTELGYNDLNCAVHTDIITTSPRTVVAIMDDDREVTIYSNGQFTV